MRLKKCLQLCVISLLILVLNQFVTPERMSKNPFKHIIHYLIPRLSQDCSKRFYSSISMPDNIKRHPVVVFINVSYFISTHRLYHPCGFLYDNFNPLFTVCIKSYHSALILWNILGKNLFSWIFVAKLTLAVRGRFRLQISSPL